YLFEALLIVAGILLPTNGPARRDLGWKALGFTVVLNAAGLLLRDIIRYRRGRLRAAKTGLIGAFSFVIGLWILELKNAFVSAAEFLSRLREFDLNNAALQQAAGLLAFMWIAILVWMFASFGARLKSLTGKRQPLMQLLLARNNGEIEEVIGKRRD